MKTLALKPSHQAVVNDLSEWVTREIAKYGTVSQKEIADWLSGCNQNTLKGLAKAGILNLVSSERKQLPRAYNGYRSQYLNVTRYELTDVGQKIVGL